MLARMVSISWPRDPPSLASQSAEITGVSHRAQPIFVFSVETGFCPFAQAGLELLGSSNLLASASESVGITGVSQRSQSDAYYFSKNSDLGLFLGLLEHLRIRWVILWTKFKNSKITMPDTVAHTCSSSTLLGWGRRITWDREFKTSPGNIARLHLYKKLKN